MMKFAHKKKDLADLERILVICGPTGVGKTALSLHLAEELNAEIVSVDSLQVYRHLDIGTAKASREERERVPHHLIDVVDPDEDFNVADYRDRAGAAVRSILKRGKTPMLVGGTGLYIRLLIHGLIDVPEPSEELRAKYRRQAREHGKDFLHRRLRQLDPELAEKFHPNDLVRVTRGLEVFDQTGTPLSEHQREHQFRQPNFHALKLAMIRPREELYERINQRVEQMIATGLEREYQELLEIGYGPELKPMQSLGYKQMGEYLRGEISLEEAVEDIQTRTRNYAKQQVSWFRGEPQANWVMAPLLKAGEAPEVVLRDMNLFLSGEAPTLEWAQVDPYNVQRQFPS